LSAEGIHTYNENPLHASLKAWYAGQGAAFEVPVDGYIVDLVQDGVLVEIQTAHFGAMRRKIESLLPRHPVRLVHPIAEEKWIVRVGIDGEPLGRRKSPKRGRVDEVFRELVTFPKLLSHPNFTLDVVMIREEEVRRDRPPGKRRRRRQKGWVRDERRLIDVVGHRLFMTPGDFLSMIPGSVPETFTTADLAAAAKMPRWLAQKMAYCLREMEAIRAVGRCGSGVQYCRLPN
jgi:hypothetical protein